MATTTEQPMEVRNENLKIIVETEDDAAANEIKDGEIDEEEIDVNVRCGKKKGKRRRKGRK